MTTEVPSERVTSVAPKIARSWLLVPATTPENFIPDAALGVDAVIIDLEDAVAASGKYAAREHVVEWLTTGRAWVRINDATTEYWAEDLDALARTRGLAGVMLAKTESGYQIDASADRLPDDTPIVALIESAMGLEAAMSDDPMAMACPRAAGGHEPRSPAAGPDRRAHRQPMRAFCNETRLFPARSA